MDYKEKYNMWLQDPYYDEETKQELLSIKDDEEEIKERFYTELKFGTAGLRGKIGAGTNMMNKYIVAKATQGLAMAILKRGTEAAERGVVITCDVRHKSKEFAEITAQVLAANSIRVYLFDGIRPTPVLSYAVRKLHTISGVMITASHNPRNYNGYKAYWEEGSQILEDIADEILDNINSIKDNGMIQMISLEEGLSKGIITYVPKEIDESYIEDTLKLSLNDDIDKEIRVVYSPLNGTGSEFVQEVLRLRGFKNISIVKEQEDPDPDFTTVGYPNPEDPKAFAYAEALGKKVQAELLIATDPDSDRVAMEVWDDEDYVFFNGNKIAALLVNYILSSRAEQKSIPENAVIVKSIVTADLGTAIADKYGVQMVETLTGFKNVCGKANEYDITGEHVFLFGYEESIGYSYGTHVRDKDAVSSSMLIVEMAAYYRKQGKNLLSVLEDLYKEFGYYQDALVSVTLEGMDGQERITRIMNAFRENPLKNIGTINLNKVVDYKLDETGLPKSDVLKYYFDDQSWVALRPSGTEPKIKLYINAKGTSYEDARGKVELIEKIAREQMDSVQ